MSDLTDDQILLLASTEKGQNDPSIQEAAAFVVRKREREAAESAQRG